MTSECHCNHLPTIQLQLHGPLVRLNIRVGLLSVPSWAPLPLPSARLEPEQLAPWLSPRLGETVHRCLLHSTLLAWHTVVALTGAGLQQEWSTGEGESGVKNVFGQSGMSVRDGLEEARR